MLKNSCWLSNESVWLFPCSDNIVHIRVVYASCTLLTDKVSFPCLTNLTEFNDSSVDPDTPISTANAKRKDEEHRPHSALKTTSLTSNAKENLRAATTSFCFAFDVKRKAKTLRAASD